MSEDANELMLKIYADIQVIKKDLENDRRALYGNGRPGLVEDVAQIKQDLAVARARSSWFGSALAGWLSILAWLVTTTIAVVGIVLR